MTKNDNAKTPMMRQFFDLKAKYPEAMLLFRCGDFYETYCEDAVKASRVLGLTLTRRNNGGSQGDTEMAGFPYHALDTYLPRLIRAGMRVAVCDQLEDPKTTKKLVKRGVTEVVTPGVSMDDNVLSHKENNFLAAVHLGRAACGVAFLDISTGEFLVAEGTADYADKLIGSFAPKEVLFDRTRKRDFELAFGSKFFTYELDDWVFTTQNAMQKLKRQFRVETLKGFGVDHMENGIIAAGAILQYLEITQHTHTGNITSLSRIEEERYVRLDKFTIRSLELVSPMQDDGVPLLAVLDRTITPMGARLLRRWTVFPLRQTEAINERLDVVDELFRSPATRETLAERLRLIGDLERVVSKVGASRVSPREVVQLKVALQAIEPIKEACLASPNKALHDIGSRLNLCVSLRERIEREVEPDPPQLVAKGGIMRQGVDEELDRLRKVAYSGKDYLITIQEREARQTGIQSLKIGYNNVFGYYLEVRNTFKDRVPQSWVRKQTLAQAERYITQELKEYEEAILGAEDKILAIEARLFAALVAGMQEFIPQLQADAALLARADALLSLATAAEEHRYIRPQVDSSRIIDIRQGRHPVIETQLPPGETYVPNDVRLDADKEQIMIITGPNMAGKSALLRQTALITLMAQMGSFVPADKATIGAVDKIFTRVGASDNIAQGESTFMVEMTEAANILNSVTPRSLVLFDELGRGTSTYDGISIAWAIVEYLHNNDRAAARTLFATHYHELNEMAATFPRIRNYNIAVRQQDGKVLFLRTLVPGGSEHSFGIHVAEIAGMPKAVTARAAQVLRQLEAEAKTVGQQSPKVAKAAAAAKDVQLSFYQLDDPVLSQIRDELLNLDIDHLTPLEALNKLWRLRQITTG